MQTPAHLQQLFGAAAVSRQMAKLESLGLVFRRGGGSDRRVQPAVLTRSGGEIVQAITTARRRLLFGGRAWPT